MEDGVKTNLETIAFKSLLIRWLKKHDHLYMPGGWDYDKEGAELVEDTAKVLGIKPWS